MAEEQRRNGDQKQTTAEASPVSPPTLSLPKGGGAIRGMGEKFAANPVTGTGSMTVPIFTSLGRSGFGPQFSLSYDSGAGNGPFGFGWSLSVPSITRKIDKGLPQYQDAEESDIFLLSGAEDLVPVFKTNPATGEFVQDAKGNFVYDESPRDGYLVRQYRPCIEGLFARIERWTSQSTGDVYWRSISKDNITTLYGKDENARIADPDDPSRIFSWLICQSYDDKGNAIVYTYAAENSAQVSLEQPQECNRGDANSTLRTAQRYLKRTRYGNRTPNRDAAKWQATDPAALPNETWMFEVVFDYGEGHYQEQPPDANGNIFTQATSSLPSGASWPVRQDPFSTYRAGFEVRTYRLCQRVLMFHHFPGEAGVGSDCLVRATEFTYSQSPIASFITQVTQSGYVRQPGGNYVKKSLPPLSFAYSQAMISADVRDVDPESLQNLPAGADGAHYQWLDLDGEGLQGVLAEQDDGWYYKRNVSPLSFTVVAGQPTSSAHFDPVTEVATLPSFAETLAQRHQFLDLAGDGQLDCVVLERPVAGFFERTQEQDWEAFKPLPSLPNLDWSEPNLRFVDLTGDGHADILITEEDALVWHPALEEEGFGEAIRVRVPRDEETGPVVAFADATQAIFLADLSGDGLTDIVRIRNGEVCYWPNLGYGRFGAKVTMDNSPWFDAQDQFDQKRLRLADIDGSGTTDIIYLHRDGVDMYRNQCGNGWSEVERLSSFPLVDNVSSVQAVDLLGNGTACLVWTSPLPGDTRRPMRYIDLMGGRKPHLLIGATNNLGAETRVHYAPSTKFYLADKLSDTPWVTKLPFPVHVVERVETFDWISRNHFVTRYAYHHGYFDGVEREFRGFGLVEQFDTEEFAVLTGGDSPLALANRGQDAENSAANLDAASHVPPVCTKTWFHTGAYVGGDNISQHFAHEYYREPNRSETELAATLLDDTVLPVGLSADEEREACRALKGSMLRQEVYALDGAGSPAYPYGHPYAVTEQNLTIRVLQRQGTNRHAVFFTHAREALNYHYERNPADPRIGHALTLEVDEFGNVLKSVAIGYGRTQSDLPEDRDQKKQTQPLLTYTESSVTNAIAMADDYRTTLPAEIRTFELTSYTPTGPVGRFEAPDFVRPDPHDAKHLVHVFDSEIHYEQQPTSGKQRRLIEHVRTLYRKDDLTALLGLGQLEPLALGGESYKLAFTPGLLAQVFQRNGQSLLPNPAGVLGGQDADRGGYLDLDGDGRWWIPSGQVFYSLDRSDAAAQELAFTRSHFFLPHRYRDPFGATTTVRYDTYDLLVLETEDPLQNKVTAGERDATNKVTPAIDYRMLQPKLVTDPNGNRAAVAFDTLGMVVATTVMGKETEPDGITKGDLLEDFVADPLLSDLQDFVADPRTQASSLLGKATTRIVYDLERYRRAGQPPFAATLARETHFHDPGGDQTKIQISFSYSDGFGREIQKKIQAEAGDAPQRQPNVQLAAGDIRPGDLVRDAQSKPVQANTLARWVGSGRTVFNNKGKPVRQYEPFFSVTHLYEPEREMTDTGVTSVLFYDPVERVVATLHPYHTYEKVVFDPWQQESWDVNDTVLQADPAQDPDVGDFLRRLPNTEYSPTWNEARKNSQLGPEEESAAVKAAAHANTPSVAHFDTLGRTFLTVANNGKDTDGNEVLFVSRVDLDIEGNHRKVIDAKDRTVMTYDYDMLSNRIHQASMEAGERWLLNDVAGKPIRAWDSRGHTFRTEYDDLRRPVQSFVTGADPQDPAREILYARTVYGEGLGAALNHRGRVYQIFDSAGVVTNEAYDIKGNLLHSTRELLPDYRDAVDWQQNPTPNDGSFTTTTEYDALNRPTAVTTPDNSTYHPTYNEANLLDKVEVNLRGAAATPFVTNIDYNAKGQRTLIHYANGAETTYEYDPLTFRLTRLRTTRFAGLNGLASQLFKDLTVVQDLRYTYDPAGNITGIADDALQVIFYNNERIEPVCEYTYDAIYRLIDATGREHIGQTTFDFNPPNGNFRDYPLIGLHANPNDLQAVRNYTEHYQYDEVGNFLHLIHQAQNANWTRDYNYNELSLVEPGKINNRLSNTVVGGTTETYTYDAHGNITSMPHLPTMEWDCKDQLHATQQQVVNNAPGEKSYYVYDATGQRVRKVTESASGTKTKERIYLGGFELYREYSGISKTLERETLHIMDDKRRIAFVETKTVDAQSPISNPQPLIRYQLDNHLGSACLELDDSGAVISYEEYHPYGSTSYQGGHSIAEASLKRYRYTGKERDEETGLYYHGARYYAPWLGRWTSCDPAGLIDGSNLYRYSRDNPVNLYDPNGTDASEYDMRQEDKEILGKLQLGSSVPPQLQYRLNEQVLAQTNEELRKEIKILDPDTLSEAHFDPKRTEQVVRDMEATLPKTKTLDYQADRAAAWAKFVMEQEDYRKTQEELLKEAGLQKELPSGAAAFLPLYGPGKSSYVHFAHGNYGRGIVYGALAISDVFLVKSLVLSGGRLLGKGFGIALAGEAQRSVATGALEVSSGSVRVGLADTKATAVLISGQQTMNASNAETRLFLESLSQEAEVSVSRTPYGKMIQQGTATSVGVEGGPSVISTLHTHPTSGVALFSQSDVATFASAGYGGSTKHAVLGLKWPNAARILALEGAEPALDVVKTTVTQKRVLTRAWTKVELSF